MEKDTGSALLVLVRWAPGLQQSILAFCLLSMPEISLCLFFFLPQPEATDENPVGFSLLFCPRKLILVS